MNFYSYELNRLGFEDVDPLEFYRDLFPDGELATHQENKEDYKTGEYSAIAIEVTNKLKPDGNRKVNRYTITNDFDNLDRLMYSENFCFMAPITYAGKSRDSKNSRFMYALCIEIDNLCIKTKQCNKKNSNDYKFRYNKEKRVYEEYIYSGLENLIKDINSNKLPRPTYIVASGTGLHLYYVFIKPIPMFRNIVKEIEKYKRELTKRLWNKKVTYSYRTEDIQFESIFQGFRMPGTYTKVGLKSHNKRDDLATVHRVGEKVTVEYLNQYVPEKNKMNTVYKSKLTKAQAAELYPEWYDRRIVNGEKKGHWVCSENVYNWWYNRINNDASLGHRYYCLMILAIYAIKCDIPYEKLEKDCFSLQERFEELTTDENNHFTEKDILDALQAFHDKEFVTYPINSITNRSGIQIEKNKRNGRSKKEHMKYMRGIKDIKIQLGECSAGGRPEKKEIVKFWQELHPNGTKYQCQKETGLSKPTIYKWWDDSLCKNDNELNEEEIISF